MSLFEQLKRRNVFRVAAAYLAGAWLLVEVVETLFPLYGLSNDAVRLVVTSLAILFPLVLIFSWVYELTPEGLRLEKDIDRKAEPDRRSATRLDRIIILLLALALGYFAFDKFALEPKRLAVVAETAHQSGADHSSEPGPPASPQKSIAVLPFINLSPDTGQDYFVDGLTEELIGALAKVRGLHVTARTSAFVFKDARRDIREIGERLNVRTVLEGSVRQEHDRVRVMVELIDTGNGFNIWSESYDYELRSVLALQEKIAKAIVAALELQLSPRVDTLLSTSAPVNPEAYDLYLKGRYYWARLDSGGLRKSVESFQQAIAVDPAFAPAHAGLANAYSLSGYFGIMPPTVAYPLSIRESEAALSLDPASTEALIARGMAWLVYEWQWEQAREKLSLAVSLSPNDAMAHWAWSLYLATFDAPAALDAALEALSLDPLSLPLMNLVAFRYLDLQRYADAIRMDEEMIALNPQFSAAYWNLGIVRMLQGNFEEAIAGFTRSVEYSGRMPPTLAFLAYAFARSGDEESASAILAELEALRESPEKGYASPLLIAMVCEGLGRKEDALDWLDQAVRERDGFLVSLNSFPRFELLRDEPRFRDILDQLDLPEAKP
jgi:serine/threonine-protein kinase